MSGFSFSTDAVLAFLAWDTVLGDLEAKEWRVGAGGTALLNFFHFRAISLWAV